MMLIKAFVVLQLICHYKLLTKRDILEWLIGMNMELYCMNSFVVFRLFTLKLELNFIKMLEQESLDFREEHQSNLEIL